MIVCNAKPILIALALFVASALTRGNAVTAQVASDTGQANAGRVLTRLPAGTKLGQTNSTGRWNRVVLMAKPTISSGDVAKLSTTIRDAATTLTLAIVANVSVNRDGKGYVLGDVGVGYCVPLGGQPTVITSATQSTLGANLGFIQRRILSTNETQLGAVKSIAHTSTLMIFDAPAIMHRSSQHRDYVTRHLVWIDAATGDGATLVWLLARNATGRMQPVNEPLRLLAHGTQESRGVHVDGGEFTFGFPSERAFALEDLPPGKKHAWTKEMAAVAALPRYTTDQLTQLSTAVNDVIADTK